ncbi:hypothetical protein LF252_16400 [Hymenobacter sp. BT728]|nr:hypothetical protein [Hymenobacter pini]
MPHHAGGGRHGRLHAVVAGERGGYYSSEISTRTWQAGNYFPDGPGPVFRPGSWKRPPSATPGL